MSTDIPYGYSTPQVVYGIKVEDSRSAVLVKRVTNVSLCLLLCSYIRALFYNSFEDGFSMIITYTLDDVCFTCAVLRILWRETAR